MGPDRWRRIDQLFDSAIRVDPSERGEWLRRACGEDEALRAELGRLLAQDDEAERDGFLTPPDGPSRNSRETATWPPRGARATGPAGAAEADGFRNRARAPSPRPRGGLAFAPRPTIFSGGGAGGADAGTASTSEAQALLRARLRELPVIYILIVATGFLFRALVYRYADLTIPVLNVLVILAFVGVGALLWGRRELSAARLRALELIMVGMIAGKYAFSQYWIMLQYSRAGDVMTAWIAMKNVVLITAALLLAYGFYVPKTWRRAALGVAPLAVAPFAVLLALHWNHPRTMAWLGQGWMASGISPQELFGFDAMLLLILALGSVYGAHIMSSLRRQVVEARQLGQYRLRRRIGGGGMGEVYLAEHQLLKRPCALKLIRPGRIADPGAIERFEREVRITATLSHPNIVEIFDYGRTEEGTYYYVMELLSGLSLERLVESVGPLPPERAVYLLRQVCRALSEAHAAGLVHRDVKPSNIFAARRGRMADVAKLLDFGLVLPTNSGTGPTRPDAPSFEAGVENHVAGTPLFMAPEQSAGGPEVDVRSDIYALGAVAYYVLTGRPPFDQGSGVGALLAHARSPAPPLSRFRTDVPRDLERVVLRCLAKAPADRFADADSLERALGACACAGGWDEDRASLWWLGAGRAFQSHPGPF